MRAKGEEGSSGGVPDGGGSSSAGPVASGGTGTGSGAAGAAGGVGRAGKSGPPAGLIGVVWGMRAPASGGGGSPAFAGAFGPSPMFPPEGIGGELTAGSEGIGEICISPVPSVFIPPDGGGVRCSSTVEGRPFWAGVDWGSESSEPVGTLCAGMFGFGLTGSGAWSFVPGFGSEVSGCVVAFAVGVGSDSSEGDMRRTAAMPAARLNTAEAPIAACFLLARAPTNASNRLRMEGGRPVGGTGVAGTSGGFPLPLAGSGFSVAFTAVRSGPAAGFAAGIDFSDTSTAMGSVIRDPFGISD